MKKLLTFITVVIATVVIADILFGIGCRYYVKNHKIPGDYESIDYLIKTSTDDMIILGSSVALNSTIPSILEDTLGISVWNGACNGQRLPYFETILDCLFARHKPKVVVLGLRENELVDSSKGSRYNILSPYYGLGFDVLDHYIEEGSWINKVMAHSNLYRYNTIWIRILLYNFIQPGEKGEKGFIAKNIPPYFPKMIQEDGETDVTEQGVEEFTKIVKMCRENSVKVIAFFPPLFKEYKNHQSKAVTSTKDFCIKNEIAVYDTFQDSLFLQNPELFYDNIHLNKEGASVFSSQLAHELKKILKEDGLIE